MAFIPDNSFDQRLREKLLPILWEFYEYNCRKRNHESRRSSGTIDEFISLYGYKRASKFILQKQLKSCHWFGGTDGNYELLVGDFSPVDKKADERKAKREQSKKIDLPEDKSKNLDSESKKLDYQSKKIDSHIRNIPASLPAEIPEEESLSARAREIPKTSINGRAGIFVGELSEDSAKTSLIDAIFDGMKVRLGTPHVLPKEFRWREAAHFTWLNRFSAERFLQTYDLLDLVRKKKNKNWQITPEMIEGNIANLESLQIELRNLENGKISDGNNRETQTAKQIADGERLNAIFADAERFESPAVN